MPNNMSSPEGNLPQQPGFQPATAGGPSTDIEIQQDPKTENILNATFGRKPDTNLSTTTNTTTGIGVPAQGSEGGIPTGVKVAAAVFGAGAVLGGAAYGAHEAGLFGDDGDPSSSHTQVIPTPEKPTNIPGTNIANPTLTPESTQTATPTESPPAPGEYGKYTSIDELPVSAETKDYLKEILKDSKVFITTDRTIIAVENNVMTRENCNVKGAVVNCSQLHSVKLNTTDYPEASTNLDLGVDIAQYHAWKAENKDSSLTLEQYLATPVEQRNNQYSLRGYENGEYKEERQIITVDPKDFRVIKITNNSEPVSIWNTNTLGEYYETYPGIFVVNVFARDLVAKGFVDSEGNNAERYRFASGIDLALASMSDEGADKVLSGPYGQGTGTLSSTIVPISYEIQEAHIPNKSKPLGWNSIFTTTGTVYTP